MKNQNSKTPLVIPEKLGVNNHSILEAIKANLNHKSNLLEIMKAYPKLFIKVQIYLPKKIHQITGPIINEYNIQTAAPLTENQKMEIIMDIAENKEKAVA